MFILYISQGFAFIAIWMQIAGFNPVDPISIFNLSFIPTCMAVSWAIYGLRIGQSLPIMREKVVETMRDSVIVLDSQNCAAYLNPAARMMFKSFQNTAPKNTSHQLDPQLEKFILAVETNSENKSDFVTLGEMIFSVSRSIIEDWKGDTTGQILVLRNVTDRDRMEKALQAHAVKQARSMAFTQSLSQLAARIAVSSDLEQILTTLRDELHRLGLEFCVASRVPNQKGYSIEYLSLDHAILQLMEKMLGKKAKGFHLPELGELTGPNAIEEDGAIYMPKISDNLHMIFEKLPHNFEQIFWDSVGISLHISSLSFRLIARDEDIGIISFWGESLLQEDLSTFSVFASQVSAAIQKARLVQNEQRRINELERTNRFILSLTQVATYFEANLTVDQILEVLGKELRKLDATFVIAFLDPDSGELVGNYISASPGIWAAVEKITGVSLKDFHIPYTVWEDLDPNATGAANIIHDPVQYVFTTLKNVPKSIIKRGLHMLGITPNAPAVWMPLRANGRNMGVLMIWGIKEPHPYLTIYSLFAQQVATAIEKARLMADLESLKSFNEGIVQGVAEGIILLNPEGQILFTNPAVGEMVGLPLDKLLGKKWDQFIPSADLEKVRHWLATPEANHAVGVELTILHQHGSPIPVLANIQTIFKDGQPDGTLVSMMDIHQRIEAEQHVRASMEEKEALLKEIHHRVKNNLQIVSSLLNLQASRFEDKNMIEAFRESQNRVRSMALIHEKLYRSNNLARIRFDEYIKELGQFLMRTYNNPARRIQLEVKADAVNLDIDSAIPCGLIINELVTNSIKHGFPITQKSPSSKPARISINLALLPEHQIQFTISDNGIGFPEDRDYQNSGSLGLQLVTSLTHQLGGEVAFKTNQGAQTEINFTSESAYLG
jgi:PAS domain S-box-containing protein